MKNSKTKTEVASSAETSKPVENQAQRQTEPESNQVRDIAVQGKPEEKPVPQDAPQVKFVGIADLVKDIPDEKVEMAEKLGIPIKGILRWMQVMEHTVIEDRKAMIDFGVTLQPLADLAQKVKAQQGAATPGAAPKDAGGLQMLMGLLKESGLVGGQAGISEGDRYFMEMGRESASLGNFVAKELFKKMMPEAIAKFDSERAAAKKA